MNKNPSLILLVAWAALLSPVHAEKPSPPYLSRGEALPYWRVDVEHKSLPTPAASSANPDPLDVLRQERAAKAFPRTKSATGTRDDDKWEVVVTFEDGKKQQVWFANGFFLNRTVSKYYGPMFNVIEPSAMGASASSIPFLDEFTWIGEDTYVKDSGRGGYACHVYTSKIPVTLPYSPKIKQSIATVYIDKKTKLPISAENDSTILNFSYERPAGVKVNIPPEAIAVLDNYLKANALK